MWSARRAGGSIRGRPSGDASPGRAGEAPGGERGGGPGRYGKRFRRGRGRSLEGARTVAGGGSEGARTGVPGRRGRGVRAGRRPVVRILELPTDQVVFGFRMVGQRLVREVRPALAGVPSPGLPARSWRVAVRPAVRSGPVRTEALAWVLRGSARRTGRCGLGETAVSFPAGGGQVREANCASRTVRRPRPGSRVGRGEGSASRCPAGPALGHEAGRRTHVHARARVGGFVREFVREAGREPLREAGGCPGGSRLGVRVAVRVALSNRSRAPGRLRQLVILSDAGASKSSDMRTKTAMNFRRSGSKAP